jgi:hypothetical protein
VFSTRYISTRYIYIPPHANHTLEKSWNRVGKGLRARSNLLVFLSSPTVSVRGPATSNNGSLLEIVSTHDISPKDTFISESAQILIGEGERKCQEIPCVE